MDYITATTPIPLLTRSGDVFHPQLRSGFGAETILTMGDLTFRKAVEEAEMACAERASKNVMEFHHESVPEVHRLPVRTGGCCYRCDGQHDPQTFLQKKKKKKRGHIERACMSIYIYIVEVVAHHGKNGRLHPEL